MIKMAFICYMNRILWTNMAINSMQCNCVTVFKEINLIITCNKYWRNKGNIPHTFEFPIPLGPFLKKCMTFKVHLDYNLDNTYLLNGVPLLSYWSTQSADQKWPFIQYHIQRHNDSIAFCKRKTSVIFMVCAWCHIFAREDFHYFF